MSERSSERILEPLIDADSRKSSGPEVGACSQAMLGMDLCASAVDSSLLWEIRVLETIDPRHELHRRAAEDAEEEAGMGIATRSTDASAKLLVSAVQKSGCSNPRQSPLRLQTSMSLCLRGGTFLPYPAPIQTRTCQPYDRGRYVWHEDDAGY